MNIDDLTLGQIKEIRSMIGEKNSASKTHIKTGSNVFIRTVIHSHTGNVVAVTDSEIVLKDAAWIAYTGRFMNALKTCNFDEVEPFPANTNVIINRLAVIDICEIEKLPTEQK